MSDSVRHHDLSSVLQVCRTIIHESLISEIVDKPLA
jgi:hypothetical protein